LEAKAREVGEAQEAEAQEAQEAQEGAAAWWPFCVVMRTGATRRRSA
jgi:hypothetical protein